MNPVSSWLVSILAGVAVSAAWGISGGAEARWLTIASWNMSNFGNAESDCPPERLQKIATILTSDDVDVIALQEVLCVCGRTPSASSCLDQLVDELTRQAQPDGGDWRCLDVEPSPADGRQEHYAFLYRADKMRLVEPHGAIPGSPGDPFAGRPPGYACFQTLDGTYDFLLATYHAPSPNYDPKDDLHRLGEAWGPFLTESPRQVDAFLAGDFNVGVKVRGESLPELAAFVDGGTTWAGQPYDTILAAPGAGWRRFTGWAQSDSRTIAEKGDHALVWASFWIAFAGNR